MLKDSGDISDFDNCPARTRADATAGNADAQFGLAAYLAAGPEPRDFAEALQWYQRAADQDHRLAQFNLGQMFAHGQGTPKNDSMALAWIRRAANGGDAGAQFEMGHRYEKASIGGGETDAVESRVEAYKWFILAGAQEYRDANRRSDAMTIRMTRDEVTEGAHRATTFVPANRLARA